MCSVLGQLNEISDFKFEKCGDIILAPKQNVFAFVCTYCDDIFTQAIVFMRHLRWTHNHAFYDCDQDMAAVYTVEELLGMNTGVGMSLGEGCGESTADMEHALKNEDTETKECSELSELLLNLQDELNPNDLRIIDRLTKRTEHADEQVCDNDKDVNKAGKTITEDQSKKDTNKAGKTITQDQSEKDTNKDAKTTPEDQSEKDVIIAGKTTTEDQSEKAINTPTKLEKLQLENMPNTTYSEKGEEDMSLDEDLCPANEKSALEGSAVEMIKNELVSEQTKIDQSARKVPKASTRRSSVAAETTNVTAQDALAPNIKETKNLHMEEQNNLNSASAVDSKKKMVQTELISQKNEVTCNKRKLSQDEAAPEVKQLKIENKPLVETPVNHTSPAVKVYSSNRTKVLQQMRDVKEKIFKEIEKENKSSTIENNSTHEALKKVEQINITAIDILPSLDIPAMGYSSIQTPEGISFQDIKLTAAASANIKDEKMTRKKTVQVCATSQLSFQSVNEQKAVVTETGGAGDKLLTAMLEDDSLTEAEENEEAFIGKDEELSMLETIGLSIIKDSYSDRSISLEEEELALEKAKQFSYIFQLHKDIWSTQSPETKSAEKINVAFSALTKEVNAVFETQFTISKLKCIANLITIWHREQHYRKQVNKKKLSKSVMSFKEQFWFLPKIRSMLYCEYCAEQFRTIMPYKKHKGTHCLARKCKFCPWESKNIIALGNHERKEHYHKCGMCLAEFSSYKEYDSHKKDKHCLVCWKCKVVIKGPCAFSLHKREHGEFECPACQMIFEKEKDLNEHSASVHRSIFS